MRRETDLGYCTHIYAPLQAPVDDISHDALLIHAYGLLMTVADDVDDHFLLAVLTLRLAAIMLTQIGNVIHDALHSPCKWAIVLIVHDHDDGWLGSARPGHSGPDGG